MTRYINKNFLRPDASQSSTLRLVGQLLEITHHGYRGILMTDFEWKIERTHSGYFLRVSGMLLSPDFCRTCNCSTMSVAVMDGQDLCVRCNKVLLEPVLPPNNYKALLRGVAEALFPAVCGCGDELSGNFSTLAAPVVCSWCAGNNEGETNDEE